ncbi:hypothetical protein A6D6_01506 [Alcanivorax xiamenensis]|uniref:Uncharacterized protein n=2 Tax=Alcanivorax xiamenensis TaxID=1177156 RepID=A0ABQ6YAL1_9GAMM|nr:hypothetical protein A6D6_01506 [Alcanivorax xiamenensis]
MVRIGSLSLLICMALISGCSTPPNVHDRFGTGLFTVDPEKERSEMDALARQLETAIAAGKSVVISPALSDDAYYQGYRGGDGLDVLWEDPGQDGKTFSFTWHEASVAQNMGPPIFIRVAGQDYLVSAQEPGQYRLKASRFKAKDANLNGLKITGKPVEPRGLGAVYLSAGTYVSREWVQEWQDEIALEGRSRFKIRCAPTVGGHCLPHHVIETQKTVLRPAGYQPTANYVDKSAVNAIVVLDHDFASFELGPGEVVLIDGLFARPPNISFDDSDCVASPTNKGVECELRSVTMQRLTSSIENFQAGLAEEVLTPERRQRPFLVASRNYRVPSPDLAALLSFATYRTIHVTATPGDRVEDWGQTYFLSAD